jgi:glutathione S-transferase
MAIIQYLAKKYMDQNYSAEEMAMIDMAAFEARDVRWVDPASPKVQNVVNFLGTKEWICGSFTYADFMFYEMIISLWRKDSTLYERFPTLRLYKDRFENIPSIKSYFEKNPVVNEWQMTLQYF